MRLQIMPKKSLNSKHSLSWGQGGESRCQRGLGGKGEGGGGERPTVFKNKGHKPDRLKGLGSRECGAFF